MVRWRHAWRCHRILSFFGYVWFISVHEFVFFWDLDFSFDCISFVCQSAVSRFVIHAFVIHIVCHGSLTFGSRTLWRRLDQSVTDRSDVRRVTLLTILYDHTETIYILLWICCVSCYTWNWYENNDLISIQYNKSLPSISSGIPSGTLGGFANNRTDKDRRRRNSTRRKNYEIVTNCGELDPSVHTDDHRLPQQVHRWEGTDARR